MLQSFAVNLLGAPLPEWRAALDGTGPTAHVERHRYEASQYSGNCLATPGLSCKVATSEASGKIRENKSVPAVRSALGGQHSWLTDVVATWIALAVALDLHTSSPLGLHLRSQ